ncbi:hypothetical protein GPECTOR_82g249 [Gonium pectorale]|uniref:Uncharacterized protein n=1 Tax=Gonium pectorale TaxID=33097 RepID=A0A150G2H8_GONPE|nr:hypothetical protein GPECTOR_82g249 [Gonium pectorale]|eukprot:KXZ43715.1 hypothetical protein GPECTOR_82g249 [Gonium pectorale]
MEHSEEMETSHGHGHGIWMCDGEPLMTEGGSWIGHVLPGVVFILWGLHWMQGIYRNYFNSRRLKGQEYRAQTTHSLWKLPPCSESVCKAFLPCLAISIELFFAHRGGWRTLICPAGTPRAGHVYGPHIGNWQHAAMYPAFILAGIVDLVGMEVELPPGTQQVFLFLAFLCESLLMGLHKKHTPLDIAVHSVLFYTMLATAVFILLEAIHPRNFMLSCGRVAATLLQGTWFFAAAHIMFTHRPAWDEMGGEDMSPAMMVPVVFVGLILLVLVVMFPAYLATHAWYLVMDGYSLPYERANLLDEERSEGGRGAAAAVPMTTVSPSGTSCQV